jgi:hypothetical protein
MTVFTRTAQIISSEGLPALLKQGIQYFWNSIQSHGEFYVIEFDYRSQPEIPDIKPRIDCTYKQISSVSDYDILLAQGYRFGPRKFRPKLKNGAMAFCLFVEKDLASETWAAVDSKSKKVVDPIPFQVDFDKGEVCVGVRFTNPKYRRNGLSEYVYAMRLPYLKERFTKAKASVNVNNKASQRINDIFYGKVISRGSYFRFFGLQYWKEKTPAM